MPAVGQHCFRSFNLSCRCGTLEPDEALREFLSAESFDGQGFAPNGSELW